MGDFFYYGQKDTIRRLNELAGRGAVVASYAPAVGRSPLGGPNGFMNPAWFDPNLPLYTNVPLAVKAVGKFGYSFLHGGQPQALYKIATLPVSGLGTYASLRIDGVLGGWGSTYLSAMTVTMGNRNGFSVDWSSSRYPPIDARFLVLQEADGSHSVYLFFRPSSFAQAAFNLQGTGCQTYATPSAVGSVLGTLVWDSGASVAEAGYIAPVWRGAQTGVGTLTNEFLGVGDGAIATSFLAAGAKHDEHPSGAGKEVLGLGVGGVSNSAHAGRFGFLAGAGNGVVFKEGYKLALRAYDTGSNVWSADLLSIKGDGAVYMPLLKAGSSDPSTLRHNICRGTGQAAEIIYFGVDGAPAPSVGILAADGTGGWAASTAVLYVGKNSVTGRSIASGGTITGQGSDVAEYFWKCPSCASVAAGQVVGINNKNQITDLWAEAVMFAIKSTDPSFVGGDIWSKNVGQRPTPKAGAAPTEPKRRANVVTQQPVPGANPPEYEDVVTDPGDTDDDWAEKQTAYTAALAAHNIAVQQDAEAMAVFNAALEVERQKVDRIAIAGRVPVNVQGAQPGDYIVPVPDGVGIKGISIRKADLPNSQYLDAVGRVISIEPDGRAYVMVKVV
ncbi:hypothetical protein [Janthinobacterium sp. DSP2-3-3]|uniref:hypothetical protein n=1 Tax=Janthinobacterium sp. DSP2-3-3 TaxID=2804596 RepID=UPI003CE6951B